MKLPDGYSLFDTVNIAILIINSENGSIRYANPFACNYYGYVFDDFVKLNIGQLNPQPLEKTLTDLRMVCSGEKDYYKTLHKSASGENLDIGIYSSPIEYSNEKMIIALIHDNKNNKESENRLRSLSRAVEQSPATIVITDIKGKIEYVNPGFTQITGYSFEDVSGKDPSVLKTGDGDRKEIKELWQTILSGEVWRGEFCNRKKNGEIYWESASISPVFDEDGHLTNFVAVKEDITKARQDQNRITEALRFNRAILETSPIGIIIYRSDGQCISANPAAGKLLGAKPELLVRQNFNDLQAWKEYGILEIAKQTIEKNEPISSEFFYKSTFGKEIWMDATCTPFRFDAEQDLHLLFMFEDFSDRKQIELNLQKATDELATWANRLEKRDKAATCMRDFGEMLQVCFESTEIFNVIRKFGPWLFPDSSGCVYLFNESESLLKAGACWGNDLLSDIEFPIDDCWALRRGQLYIVESSSSQLVCRHMPEEYPGSYIEFPMVASGKISGLLHVEWHDHHEIDKDIQDFITDIADMISLSISNTRLREKLRDQSIRDPLTGVFNRRFLEETLGRDFPRAQRRNAPIGIMMMDIDHFKTFNDTFGHEAGDLVLQKVGELLLANTRREDIVCRYGGEEFSVIMPEADLQITSERAEIIRTSISELDLFYGQSRLGKVTISIGVANFPLNGETGTEVIQAADRAMYRAKEQGRNRVVQA